jgi:hypothetical protein
MPSMTTTALREAWIAKQGGIKFDIDRKVGLYTCDMVFMEKLLILNQAPAMAKELSRDKCLRSAGFTVLNYTGGQLDEKAFKEHEQWPVLDAKQVGEAFGRIGAWAQQAKKAMGQKRRHPRKTGTR